MMPKQGLGAGSMGMGGCGAGAYSVSRAQFCEAAGEVRLLVVNTKSPRDLRVNPQKSILEGGLV